MEFYVKCIQSSGLYFTKGETYHYKNGYLKDNTPATWIAIGSDSVNPDEWNLVHYKFEKIHNHQEKKITIKVEDNKVIAKMGNKIGVAKCSSEDEFDYYTGVKIAIDRLFGKTEKEKVESKSDKIKVGDTVEVVNIGSTYRFYSGWFAKNNLSVEECVRYGYGYTPSNNDKGIVVRIAPHGYLDDTLYLIRLTESRIPSAYILMGESGIKKVKENKVKEN